MFRFRKVINLFLSTSIIIPVALIILYIGLSIFFKGSSLSASGIVTNAASIYSRYGYEIIFIGAFIEALVIINFFMPGITIVVLGAIFARTGHINLTVAILAATAGSMLGFIVDFLFGYFGFGELINRLGYGAALKKAKKGVEESSIKTFALSFIHPDIGSFVALAAGTVEMNFRKFLILATLSTLIWTSIWAILVFAFGKIFLTILTKYTTVLVILVVSIWILWSLYEKRKEKK